jgi:hypothetical protein
MKKTFYLFTLLFLLNGCVESIAFLGSSVGGASSGKMLQSTVQSTFSYGIKKQTGKTPLGHALAYAEKNNPENKRETCISFIEKTKSEFCTIAKKKISLTSRVIKEKVFTTKKKTPEILNSTLKESAIKPKIKTVSEELSSVHSFNLFNKSPRELAITFQNELKKKSKDKYLKKNLVSR